MGHSPLQSILRALARPLRPLSNKMLLDGTRRADLPAMRRALLLGASPDARGADGFTPLTSIHTFRDETATDAALLLLSAKADPNGRNKTGQTPLHLAALFRLERTCRTLLDAGADPEAINPRALTPIQLLRGYLEESGLDHGADEVARLEALFEQAALRRCPLGQEEPPTPRKRSARL